MAVCVSARLVISSQTLTTKLHPKPVRWSTRVLEVTESHRVLHEYMNIDDYFITDAISRTRGSELDP